MVLNLLCECILGKIFEVEMLIRTLPTTLVQILCKLISNSKVIVKINAETDENFVEEVLGINMLIIRSP